MNYLLLSGQGKGLGLLLRLRFEGHKVVSWVRHSPAKVNYEGLIEKVTGWERYLTPDTTVLFDSIGAARSVERLKSEGIRVVGGGQLSDQLEFDWETMRLELENVGLSVANKSAIAPIHSVEGWFEKGSFRPYTIWSLRRTRLMDGDLGPRTDCTGTFAWVVKDIHPKLQILAPLFSYHDYIGPVNLTLDNDEQVVDLVARLTWDTLPALLECNSAHDLFSENSEFVPAEKYCAAIRISQPGYGTSKRTMGGHIVKGLTKEDRLHFYMFNLALDKANQLVTTGYDGALLSVMGSGATPMMAWERAYVLAERVQVTDIQYRMDLARVLSHDYYRLKEALHEEDAVSTSSVSA